MHRLLYISTARHVFSPEEIDAVLRISRRNNLAVGITGLLVVGGRRFLQALEGPDHVVMTTYERIRRDPRHFGIVQLASQSIVERAFDGWAMGYKQGGVSTGGQDLAADVAALVEPIDDPSLRAYFTGFAQMHAA